MTIPASTVPTTKAYLYSGIKAAATAVTGFALLVTYGDLGTYQPDDVIIVGDVVDRRTEPGAFVGGGGANWLDERYGVEVVIDCFREGDYAAQADARAWALASVVESVVRTDPGLGTTNGQPNVIEARPSSSRSESSWDDERGGWHVRVTVTVAVYASI